MKERSHRVSEVCEKDADKTIQRTRTRRLDGYRLYSAIGLQVRQACGGQVRRRARQLRWGAVLLKAVDRQLGVTAAVARCLRDRRQPGKVQHDRLALVRQRLFGLVLGYADCNDAARLGDDAMHKLLLDRDPLTGPALASQATLSRFENAVGSVALTTLGHALADLVIEQHRARRQGRARRITIDLDPTDDPTHGQQQFTFFNGHYDTWCYLPLLGFVSFDAEPEQYAVLALLRPGNSGA